MDDESSKSSCTMQIPKLCRQTHGGPFIVGLTSDDPWVKLTGKRHKDKTAQDSQIMRSGQSRRNNWDSATTFLSQLARNTQQEQVNNTTKLPQLSQCFSVAAEAPSAILPCSGKKMWKMWYHRPFHQKNHGYLTDQSNKMTVCLPQNPRYRPITDNGRHFKSHKIILKVRGFTIVSSSPYYSQGKEKAESAVKIVKNIFKKSQKRILIWLS